MLRTLSLFAGIGGFDLGLERTGGFRTVAFCECAEFPRRVLAKHWPEVPCYDDVRTLTAERLRADGIAMPDIICGGFPCQDISLAGKGTGLSGERSGLWWEYHRLIAECRPSWVVAENVAALRGRGLDEVLGSLSALGYDAEWHCIPAGAVGAPHRRDRVWIVAHAQRRGRDWIHERVEAGHLAPNPCGRREYGPHRAAASNHSGRVSGARSEGGDEAVAHALCGGLQRPEPSFTSSLRRRLADASSAGSAWFPEPAVGRVAHGVPSRVDRLRCLGNAVVPQIPEMIGRAILAMETQRSTANNS